MASNNGDGDGCAFFFLLILLGIAAYVAFLIAMAVYAFVLFCSLVLTFFSLLAWHRGLSLFGLHVSPLHARLFLVRGALGAVLFPAFVWFAASYYGLRVESWLWPHIAFGGYALCSAGVLLMGSDGGVGLLEEIAEIETSPRAQPLPPPRSALGPAESRHDERPTFASWDDEEELRR